ncbi:MAG: hypothetical protein Fur0023_03120 [Bacteroidia bacterium]
MNYSIITPIPEVPKQIFEAVNSNTLAVFIGAGISKLLGSDSWDAIAHKLINRCYKENIINYREYESLKQLKHPKKIITICHRLLIESNNEEIYYSTLKKAIKADKNLINSQNIYDEIYRLRALFITTNIDSHFHKYFEPVNIVSKENEFTTSNIDRNKLYQIHGCLERDKNSIIFTVSDYIKRYNKEKFKHFLEKIFSEYTILFLGYGLAEFELLDFLITKYDRHSEHRELKHFILLPFYRGEENLLKYESYYYNSMGIEVIPYEKDERGYAQLYEVLKKWDEEINHVSIYLYDTYEYLKRLADNYENSEEYKVFQYIKNDEPQRNHFFKSLALSPNPFLWLTPLKEKGYFNPANNPKPQKVADNKELYTIPYWSILGYLENVAKKNKENPSEKITNTLLEIVQDIIDYKDENGERIDNYRTDWIVVKIIFSLPIEKINIKHIQFLRISLNSKWDSLLVSSEIKETILPRLLNEGSKAKNLTLELLKVILDFKKVKDKFIYTENEFFEYTSIMDEYSFFDTLMIHKAQIAKVCGVDAISIAIQKMKTITNEDAGQFNPLDIPTVEDHPQTTFPEKYQNQLVYFVRDVLSYIKPEDRKNVIENLLKEEHSIFKRIVFHTINYHYEELNHLLWNYKKNPLDEDFVNHELYELFKNHAKEFTKEQIKTIVNWIETKNYGIEDEHDSQRKEKFLAYAKKEWLSSLLESGDTNVRELYDKYHNLNPAEQPHPGFIVWSETKTGYDNNIPVEEFLNKSNEEIVTFLDKYKDKPYREVGGVAVSFERAVRLHPEKFFSDMKTFLQLPRIFQHSLLLGLREVWTSKKYFDWEVLFNFIIELISPESFWNEEQDRYKYKDSIISRIAELIEEGTKDDNHAFESKLLPKAEEILLVLAEKTDSELPDMKDIVVSVLNSTKGKIFSAMISYSLRYARLYKRENDERWVESIKDAFEKRLNRNKYPSIEFSLSLGGYLDNLYWLDKKWVKDHINQIFLKENETHWQSAFTGYLFYTSNISQEIYFLLKENNHYLKAVETIFENEYITKRVAQHITVGYLYDWEKLDDKNSLISKLIENKNGSHFEAIIDFLWLNGPINKEKIKHLRRYNSLRRLNGPINKEKIKPLWKAMFDKLMYDIDNENNKKMIARLLLWTRLVDTIDDEISSWIQTTIKHVAKHIDILHLAEYLSYHAERTPDKVGDIWLDLTNTGVFLSYKHEYLQKTVEVLYQQHEKELADRICNIYGSKGYDFLRDIYEKYNKK